MTSGQCFQGNIFLAILPFKFFLCSKAGMVNHRRAAVLRIRIHLFLGLLDPDPDPLVRCMDPNPVPDPDPSIIKQK